MPARKNNIKTSKITPADLVPESDPEEIEPKEIEVKKPKSKKVKTKAKPKPKPKSKLKTCARCKSDLPLSEYYDAGKYKQSRCKPCHNAYRAECYRKHKQPRKIRKKYNPKPRGVARLSQENQVNLHQMIADGVSLTAIGKKLDIPYQTLQFWRRRGFIAKQGE